MKKIRFPIFILCAAAGILLSHSRFAWSVESEWVVHEEQASLPEAGAVLSADFRSFETGYVKVLFSPMPQGLRPTVTIKNKEDGSATSAKMSSSGSAVLPVGPGRYALTVSDESGAPSPRTFQWTISLMDEMDMFEPNGTLDLAVERLHKIALFPYADKDCFRLDTALAGEFKAGFEGVPEGVNPTAAFYDGAGNKISSESESVFLNEGRNALCVEDKIARFSPEPFYFAVQYLGNLDLFEPNDSPEAARAVRLDASLHLRLFPKGDKDYFTIEVKEDGDLTVIFYLLPEGVRPVMTITDKPGNVVSDGTAPAFVRAGTYLVKISDPAGSLDRPFVVRFYTRKNPDPSEPNNSFDQAMPLALGSEQTVLLTEKDEDWFWLEVKEPGFVSELLSAVEINDESANEDYAHGVRIELYDSEKNLIGSFKDDWASFNEYLRSIEVKQPGRYFIRLWREDRDHGAEGHVSLKLYVDFLSRDEFDSGQLKSDAPPDDSTIIINYGMSGDNASADQVDARIQNMLLARKRGWRLIESGYEVEELTKAFTSAIKGPEEEARRGAFPFKWIPFLVLIALFAFFYLRFFKRK